MWVLTIQIGPNQYSTIDTLPGCFQYCARIVKALYPNGVPMADRPIKIFILEPLDSGQR